MYLFFLPALIVFAVIFMIPLGLVFYTSLFDPGFTFVKYAQLLDEPLYGRVLLTTLEITATATALTLLIGYPVAYHLAGQPPRRRTLLLVLVLLPFWTSILVKSFAFAVLLGRGGLINNALAALFGEGARLELLYNRVGVMVGMTHYLLPFMVLIVLGSLLAQDGSLRRAAMMMGAGRLRIFWSITLPLSLPGVMAGTLICAILSFGMFITPALLGGRQDYMISNLIDLNVRETLDWPLASALSVALMVITALFVVGLARVRKGELFD
ncbi:ABC transporter permease [Bosea sp. (in: a-proteobacteria)]|uniref:ABC transporter permease n=1 Tax=Bosea sp. (in: a-proteobacteria) TaxID=1871050 RepID=UPI0026255A49|nr:ABC transporter permease [Bosea sp. (in: a-proteobacteria)]MCO5089484.1 ABC transporter permease [Bosea sp. (in: a-proteobacteria)]